MLVALGALLVDRVFHGQVGLWFALAISVTGYGGVSVLRGVLAGRGQLRAYGTVVGMDGLTRLLPCLVFAVAGVTAALPYGLAVGAGSVASFAVALPLARPLAPGLGPRADWSVLIPATAALVAASAIALSRGERGPGDRQRAAAGRPGPGRGVRLRLRAGPGAAVLSCTACSRCCCPYFSKSSARRDHGALRRDVRRALAVVGVLGAGALVLTAPVCRWLSGALFPDGRRCPD